MGCLEWEGWLMQEKRHAEGKQGGQLAKDYIKKKKSPKSKTVCMKQSHLC